MPLLATCDPTDLGLVVKSKSPFWSEWSLELDGYAIYTGVSKPDHVELMGYPEDIMIDFQRFVRQKLCLVLVTADEIRRPLNLKLFADRPEFIAKFSGFFTEIQPTSEYYLPLPLWAECEEETSSTAYPLDQAIDELDNHIKELIAFRENLLRIQTDATNARVLEPNSDSGLLERP